MNQITQDSIKPHAEGASGVGKASDRLDVRPDHEIEIRHTEPDDYEGLWGLWAGRKAVWGTLQVPFPSKEIWRKRLSDSAHNCYSLVAEVGAEIVGSVSLSINTGSPRLGHSGRLGMVVADQWQGKGVGTKLMDAVIDLSDRWLNLLRVELQVYVDNEPAIGLYRKFEFDVEGTHRLYALRDGEYVDAYTMARLHPHPPLFRRVASDHTWHQWR